MSRFGTMHTGDIHRECWDNLPWLANERLSPDEAARISKHLQQCGACQDELETQQRLRAAIRGADDSLVLAPQAGLQRLMSRIDAEERSAQREPSVADEPPVQLPRTATSPRWFAVAAAVQTITIGVLLGSLWWQVREARRAPSYITHTTPAPISAANGPLLRVVFAETVLLQDVRYLLKDIGAQIVAGPSEAGVYTLVLSADGRRHDQASALATLRADSRVIFSEPARAQVD